MKFQWRGGKGEGYRGDYGERIKLDEVDLIVSES